jgi:hypothetical protein
MARKAKLGSGKRFRNLTKKVGSPALSAWVMRKKYGNKKATQLSVAGRKRAARKRK